MDEALQTARRRAGLSDPFIEIGNSLLDLRIVKTIGWKWNYVEPWNDNYYSRQNMTYSEIDERLLDEGVDTWYVTLDEIKLPGSKTTTELKELLDLWKKVRL